MFNYLIGVVTGLCIYKIYIIYKGYMIERRIKTHVIECKNFEEFEKKIEQVMKDMRESNKK